MMTDTLQFEPLTSAIDAGFWFKLAQTKLDVLKLDDSKQPLLGHYSHLLRQSTSTTLPASLELGPESFSPTNTESCRNAKVRAKIGMQGWIKNTNTIEEFKSLDKQKLLQDLSEEIWREIEVGSDALDEPSILNRFQILTFADLKKYIFYYWVCFPALLPKDPFILNKKHTINEFYTEEQLQHLAQMDLPAFGLIHHENKLLSIKSLRDWNSESEKESPNLLYLDPSELEGHPAWPLRNVLFFVKHRWKCTSVTVTCIRKQASDVPDISRSIVLEIGLPGDMYQKNEMPKSVGWERNVAGKLGPRMADLGSLMDPKRLAETAVDLNLKLMKWRAMPTIPLETISNMKCLLIGAGTLGCYTARALMAWGIRNITFVDSGKVSFSNPVRQPLFNFGDCLDGGKPKAQAAAYSLQTIFPGMNSKGYNLSIPMPGHPIKDEASAIHVFNEFETLVDLHDAIFLLTDSRESRWLPSLIGAAKNKIVMNAALGFDSYLVMRHGSKSDSKMMNLGCYFCNDVVAPVDSLKDRTLDQQCTVTRPGLSLVASGLVAELFVSLVSHPEGIWAPADSNQHPSELVENPFGLVPHQIRGFLTHFSNLLVVGQSFDKCTACSARILDAYDEEGHAFLMKAINDKDYLEQVSGLKEMFSNTNDVDIEWDEEVEE